MDGRLSMEDSVLNVDGAARLLGVSHDTIYRLARETTIPAQKVGSQWRFSKAALLAWVRRGVPMGVPSLVAVDSLHALASPNDQSVHERHNQADSTLSTE